MTQKDQKTTFFAKLAAVQTELGTIPKDGKNPHFGNKYVTLDAITKKLIPLASKHGLAVFQTVEKDSDGKMELVTYVRDADNVLVQNDIQDVPQAGITNRYPLSWDSANPQKQGSAITYARRYSLGCIFQIATETDDDANAASATKRQGGYPAKPQPVTPGQLNALRAEIDRTRADLAGLFTYFHVTQLEQLTLQQADKALTLLAKRPKWQAASSNQLVDIRALCDQTGSQEGDICEHYHTTSLEELSATQAEEVIDRLKKKPGQNHHDSAANSTLAQAVEQEILMPDGSIAH